MLTQISLTKVKVNDTYFHYQLSVSHDACLVQIWWFQLKSVMSYRADKVKFTDGQTNRRRQWQYPFGLKGHRVKMSLYYKIRLLLEIWWYWFLSEISYKKPKCGTDLQSTFTPGDHRRESRDPMLWQWAHNGATWMCLFYHYCIPSQGSIPGRECLIDGDIICHTQKIDEYENMNYTGIKIFNKMNPRYFFLAPAALKSQQIPILLHIHIHTRVWGHRYYPQTSEQ